MTKTTICSLIAAVLLVPARALPQAFERTVNPARRDVAAAQVFERAVNPDAPSRSRARRPAPRSPEVPSGPPRAKALTAVTGRESAGGFSIEVVADGVLPRLYADRLSAKSGDRIVVDVPGVSANAGLASDLALPGAVAVTASVRREQPLVSRLTIQLTGKQEYTLTKAGDR